MAADTEAELLAQADATFPLLGVKGECTQPARKAMVGSLIKSAVLIRERQYEGYLGTNWLTGSRETVLDGVERQIECNGLAAAQGSANVPAAPFWNTTTNKVENLKATQQYEIFISVEYNAAPNTDIIELVARTATTNALLADFPLIVEKNVDRTATWGTFMLLITPLAITEGVKLYLKPVGGPVDLWDPQVHFKCDFEGLIDLNA